MPRRFPLHRQALIWLAVLFACIAPVAAETSGARDFLDQRWHVNPEASYLTIQSVKKNEVLETHRFTNFAGTIQPDGETEIKIDLASIETGVDIRNVRMRFLLFETYKFPLARITTKIPPAEMRRLETTKRLVYPLTFTVEMHGVSKDYSAEAIVSRTYDSAVSVTTTAPIVVAAADFGLDGGIAKLAEAVGKIAITPAAFVNFNILFEGERFNPEVRQVVAEAASRAEQTKTAAIDSESCRSELEGLSETRAIYFATGSSRITRRSAPVLDTLVTLLRRCSGVVVEAGGHTDNVGRASSNLRLSKARAAAVMRHLIGEGIPADQVRAEGYGDTRPVASNDTRDGRARNRRIEFQIVGERPFKAATKAR